MPILELIIFAALAAVVLYQLYSVLGRRVGRQPEDAATPKAGTQAKLTDRTDIEELQAAEAAEGVALSGLAAVRARDGSFDLNHFLSGSKSAYQMVVTAFAAGDRDTLRKLLSPAIFAGFDAEIARREAEDRTESVTFQHPPRADLETADVVGDKAQVTVRFLAEFRSRTTGPEGEGVDDRRTAELWTFERDLKSRDPNWTLIGVDAAQA